MRWLGLSALLLLVSACADDPPSPDPVAADSTAVTTGPTTIAALVAGTPELASLAALVERAGLDSVLADTSRAWTLFAPTNAAVSSSDLGALPTDALRARLLGHVLPTRLYSTDALGELTVETAGGTDLSMTSGDAALTISAGGTTARVVAPDLDAENGVIHTVDAVLPSP